MTAPCKDCEKRESGCHSRCDLYKEWRAEMDKAAERRQKAREAEPVLCRKVMRQVFKEMKRR